MPIGTEPLLEIDIGELADLVSKPTAEPSEHTPRKAGFYHETREPVMYRIPNDGAQLNELPFFDARYMLVLNGSTQVLTIGFDNGDIYAIAPGGVAGIPIASFRMFSAKLAGQSANASAVLLWFYAYAQDAISGQFSVPGSGSAVTVTNLPAALGQTTMAGSLPVVLANNQSAVPVSGTFWQATQPVSGTFWQATQPVSGTFWQAMQPVSEKAATSSTQGQQTSTGASVQLLAANANRKSATIRNQDSANSTWIGKTPVTAANGLLIKAGESRKWESQERCDIIDNGANHCVVDFVDYTV